MRSLSVWKALRRTWAKTLVFILLIALVSTFLCLGASLFITAQRNITKAEEDFTTIVAVSLPAMRETAGVTDAYFALEHLTDSYTHWTEQQTAWERFSALHAQVQEAGLTIPHARPDDRRMAMAYSDGISSILPDRVTVNQMSYTMPYNRIAYVLECTDTAIYGWEALVSSDTVSGGVAYGQAEPEKYLEAYAHLPFNSGFFLEQQDAERQSGQYAVASFKVEEILAIHSQAVREPEWVTAAVPYIQASESPERLFEPGKRYLVIGHYGSSSTFGYILKSGELSDDPRLKFPELGIAFEDYPLVDRQGGVTLLPKDWVGAELNPAALYGRFYIGEAGFESDEVRVELDGTVEEFLSDPANQYWKDTIESIRITNKSVQVLTTGNTNSLFPFHQNRLRITQGRDITAEEYTQGAKVCLISSELARHNRIVPGDTLPLQFYPGRFSVRLSAEGIFDNPTFIARPMPYDVSLGLTEAEGYTVVGIYSGNLMWDVADYSINAGTVILPDNAMPELANISPPDGESLIPSPLLYGLTIPNDQAQVVYDALEQVEHGRLFSIMDQGYGTVVAGLKSIRGNALWLLIICVIAWIAIVVLFFLLFIFRQEKTVGVMRSLGTTARASKRYLIGSVAVIALIAALLSAGAAYLLYDSAFDIALKAPSTESTRIDAYSEMPVTRNTDEKEQELLHAAFVPENKEALVGGSVGLQCLVIILASWLCARKITRTNPMTLIQSKEE